MTASVVRGAVVVAAVGSGLIAGTFFAFSTFVMAAVDEQQPGTAISVMQSINRTVITPLFMLAFVGTAVLAAVLLVVAIVAGDTPARVLVVTGAVAYLLTVAITGAANVPLNDQLATLDPGAADAAATWASFAGPWLGWNHARTLTAAAATALLALAA